MILIYNLPGLLFGVLGVVVGFLVASAMLAVGSPVWLAPGVLAIAGVWVAFGRAKPNFETGEMRPAPSVFFIPLFYWGLLVGFLSLPLAALEVLARQGNQQNAGERAAQDPRQQQFQKLVDGLDRNTSDDKALSEMVTTMVARVLPGQPVNVAIQSSESSVLVLMKLKNLKKIKDPDRQVLLSHIRELAAERRPGVQVYVGIKGEIFFGAISASGQADDVGKLVEEKPLLAFFDSLIKAEPASTPEGPETKSGEPDAELTKPAGTEPPTNSQPDSRDLPKKTDAE